MGAMSFVKVGPAGAVKANGGPIISVIQTTKEAGNLRMLLPSLIKTAGCFTFLNDGGKPQPYTIVSRIREFSVRLSHPNTGWYCVTRALTLAEEKYGTHGTHHPSHGPSAM